MLEPVLEVVVVGHPCHTTVSQVKKSSDTQPVNLSAGFWQAFIRVQVSATDVKLSRRPGSISAGEDGEVLHLLGIAAVHALEKGPKGFNTLFRTSLVDVMHHIVGQQGEHGLPVAGIEGAIVGADEGFSLSLRMGHGRENVAGGE